MVMKFEELVLVAALVVGLITTGWAVLAMAALQYPPSILSELRRQFRPLFPVRPNANTFPTTFSADHPRRKPRHLNIGGIVVSTEC